MWTASETVKLLVTSVFIGCLMALPSFWPEKHAPATTEVQAREIDLAAAKNVIREQLKAFRLRHAREAYLLVSDTLQRKYKSPGRFFKSIQSSYRPLYNHLSYSFLESAYVNGILIQKIELTTHDGSSHLLLCRLRMNENNIWKIDGFTLLQSDAQPI